MTVKLAETYLKLAIRLNESDQVSFEKELERWGERAARSVYAQKIEVVSYVEEGSITGWLVAAGSLMIAVEHYGGFRSGVDFLIKDAKRFSEIVLGYVRESGISPKKIVRTQKRLGLPGQMARLIKDVDELRLHGRAWSEKRYNEKVDYIKFGVVSISEQIEGADDLKVFLKGLPSEFRFGLLSQEPVVRSDEPQRVLLHPEGYRFGIQHSQLPVSHDNSQFKVEEFDHSMTSRDAQYHIEITGDGFKLRQKE
jgi:hypothetical protein